MLIKGFRFGMILQLAIGPMCLMVFNVSNTSGFVMGLTLVASIALIDAFFIVISGFGVAAVIDKEKVKAAIRIIGSVVLIAFGANIVSDVFGFSIIPKIALFSEVIGKSIFLQGLLLTLSNPLTIVFWSGVFSTEVIENKLNKIQLFFFGLGCVLATIIFLMLIAVLGSFMSNFLPAIIISILNIIVGIFLMYFGIKMFLSLYFKVD